MKAAIKLFALGLCAMLASACADLRGIGESCFESRECGRGICVQTSDAGSVCLLECDAGTLFCDNGEVCLPLDESPESVCIPGGGEEIGDVCDTSFECERGSICVDDSVTENCRQLCLPPETEGPGEDCALTENCMQLSEGRGYCTPM